MTGTSIGTAAQPAALATTLAKGAVTARRMTSHGRRRQRQGIRRTTIVARFATWVRNEVRGVGLTNVSGAQPPCDLRTEQILICCAVESEHALSECADLLAAGDFYSPHHQEIWSALLRMNELGRAVDWNTLASELGTEGLRGVGGAEYLGELHYSTEVLTNPTSHAARIATLARLRRTIEACHQLAAEGYSAGSDPETYFARVQSHAEAVSGGGGTLDTPALRDVLASAYRRLTALSDNTAKVGVSTGIPLLDAKLQLEPGCVYIVAARPGAGKSALACVMARAAALEGDVAFFSLEVDAEPVAMRMLAQSAGVDLHNVGSGRLSKVEWARLASAADEMSRLNIWIDETPGLTVTELRARARRIQSSATRAGRSLSLIVVDYMQLMSGAGKENRQQDVSDISRGLQHMSRRLGVPVLALSQLNRGVEARSDKRPTLADLRESGAIEQDAHAVMLIYRPGYYLQQRGAHDDTEGRTELIIGKLRNGPTGMLNLKFWPSSTNFTDWSATWVG